ncbi:MAG: nucleotide exchange factor GrpE [Patescibacteria group bacterium]
MEDKDTIPNENEAAADDLAKKCEEYLAGWKRAQADYANLKKEMEQAKERASQIANEKLLEKLLPAIESFDTALMSIPDVADLPEKGREKIEQWFEGINHVKWLWSAIFREIGLEMLPSEGEFDPSLHEAIAAEESEKVPEGSIVKTLQPGWKYRGQLVRAARVTIAKPKQQ